MSRTVWLVLVAANLLLPTYVAHSMQVAGGGGAISFGDCIELNTNLKLGTLNRERTECISKISAAGVGGAIANQMIQEQCSDPAGFMLLATTYATNACQSAHVGPVANEAVFAAPAAEEVDPFDQVGNSNLTSTENQPTVVPSLVAPTPMPPLRRASGTVAPTPLPNRPTTVAPTPNTGTTPATKSTGQQQTSQTASRSKAIQEPSADDNAVQGNLSGTQAVGIQDTNAAQNQANADLMTCSQSHSNASRCCGNPMSCASESERRQISKLLNPSGPSDGESLTDYCSQLQSASSGGTTANNKLASICAGHQATCSVTCENLLVKYQNLVHACNGCEAGPIYLNAFNQLAAAKRACNGLSSRAQTLASQGGSNNASTAYAQQCQSMGASNPMGLGGDTQTKNAGAKNAFNCDTNPNSAACQTCAKNPSAPGCSTYSDSRGSTGFSAVNEESKNNFSFGDGQDAVMPPYAGGANYQPQGSTYKTIPNNSGGGIPGGDSGGQARLGSNPRASTPGSPGYETGIEQGLRSGGYSQQSAAGGPLGGAGGGGANYGRLVGASDGQRAVAGMDLKQFLPGGSRYKGHIAGFAGPRSEINSKEENIWKLISNKMVEKCRLGVLKSCGYPFEKTGGR